MPDPISAAIEGLVAGAEARTSTVRFSDLMNLGGNVELPTVNFSKLKQVKSPTIMAAAFMGFRNASLSPEQRLDMEKFSFIKEAQSLEMGMQQKAYHEGRQGIREAAALSDQLDLASSPEEKQKLISSHTHLARTAPKQFAAIQASVIQELKSANESRRLDQELRQATIDGRIETGILDSFEALAGKNPFLAAKLRADINSSDPERSQRALEQLGETQETFQGPLGDALHNLELAQQRGDETAIQAATAALNKQAAPSGFRFELDPSTGKMLALSGTALEQSEVGQVPLGTRGQQQQKVIAGQFTRALVERVLPLIKPDTVGIRGSLRNVVENKVLANVRELVGLPAQANTEITEVRSLLTDIRSQAIKFLRTDSQMNMAELKLLLPALPEFSASESSDVTRQKILVLRDIVNLGDFLGRRGTGLPLDPFFSRLSPPDIRAFLQRGVNHGILTKQEALTLAKQSGAVE